MATAAIFIYLFFLQNWLLPTRERWELYGSREAESPLLQAYPTNQACLPYPSHAPSTSFDENRTRYQVGAL